MAHALSLSEPAQGMQDRIVKNTDNMTLTVFKVVKI